MHDWLRARLILALASACALSSGLSCKKADDEVTSDDESNTKKKKKSKTPPETPKKKEGAFVPTDYQGFSCGSCACSHFCTDEPEIVDKMKDDDDGGNAIIRECGKSAKIPASVAKEGHADKTAFVQVQGTKNVRPEHPNSCCYSYRTGPCAKGRPVRDGDRFVIAEHVDGSAWASAFALVDAAGAALADEPLESRAATAAHLRSIGALEHASVAAFARVSLDLLALGAPPELVTDTHVAALDEVRHARIAYALAAASDGLAIGPGPLTLPAQPPPDPHTMLIATLVEGCIGEGLGAAALHRAARTCTLPPLAALYEAMADDEARHAELAFRTVRFLLARADETARARMIESIVATMRAQPTVDEAMGEAIEPAVTMLLAVAA